MAFPRSSGHGSSRGACLSAVWELEHFSVRTFREGTSHLFIFYLFIYFINLFIYLWLCWVFIAARGLSLAVARRLGSCGTWA